MPQGDKRGTTYEFYDWSYDGEWRGDGLYNGLGSLTDGNLGPPDYKLSYYAKSKHISLLSCFNNFHRISFFPINSTIHYFNSGFSQPAITVLSVLPKYSFKCQEMCHSMTRLLIYRTILCLSMSSIEKGG
jgi:hypothetical protein